MIAMDLFYLKNMSILLDLKIMRKTGAAIAGQLFESRLAAGRILINRLFFSTGSSVRTAV
jgi:hypothetical protein